jgi:hypothetical protein
MSITNILRLFKSKFAQLREKSIIALVISLMVTIGKKILPDRTRTRGLLRFETPEEIAKRYRLPDNLYRLRVRAASALVGKSIAEGEFGASPKQKRW